jgi:hypothetical protein
MPKFIPWKRFFESVRKQPKANRQRWLGLWVFNDYGVTLRPELVGWKQPPLALLEAFALLDTQKESTIH